MIGRVLAVDPGKLTGWCWVTADLAHSEGEAAQEPFLDMAWSLIDSGCLDTVVCERYTVTAHTATLTQAPWSLEQIGVLRWMCHNRGIEFILQAPADAKRLATEETLKGVGWPRPRGAGHARDAQRHMFLWQVRNGWTDWVKAVHPRTTVL